MTTMLAAIVCSFIGASVFVMASVGECSRASHEFGQSSWLQTGDGLRALASPQRLRTLRTARPGREQFDSSDSSLIRRWRRKSKHRIGLAPWLGVPSFLVRWS